MFLTNSLPLLPASRGEPSPGETNETTWDRPFGGRRSEPRRASRAPPRAPPGAAGAAGARRREHEVSRGQRRPRPRRLGLSLEFLGSSGYVKSTSLARSE